MPGSRGQKTQEPPHDRRAEDHLTAAEQAQRLKDELLCTGDKLTPEEFEQYIGMPAALKKLQQELEDIKGHLERSEQQVTIAHEATRAVVTEQSQTTLAASEALVEKIEDITMATQTQSKTTKPVAQPRPSNDPRITATADTDIIDGEIVNETFRRRALRLAAKPLPKTWGDVGFLLEGFVGGFIAGGKTATSEWLREGAQELISGS